MGKRNKNKQTAWKQGQAMGKGGTTHKPAPPKPVATTKKVVEPEARLMLNRDDYERYMDYIRLCDAEFGMFGYVTLIETEEIHPTFYVDTLFLAPQEVSGTSVDYESEGIQYAVEKAIKDGRANDLRFSCHSHVDMAAYWSGTDEGFIRNMNNGMAPWHVSLVQNRKHEYEARVDFYNPEGDIGKFVSQFKKDLKLVIFEDLHENTDEQRIAELNEFVKRKSWNTSGKVLAPKGQGSTTQNNGTAKHGEKATNKTGSRHTWDDSAGLADAGDWLDQPANLSEWGWHPDFGWCQTQGKDIVCLYNRGEKYMTTIIGMADDVEFFEDDEDDETEVPINADASNEAALTWPADEDEAEDLWRAVMERGQG